MIHAVIDILMNDSWQILIDPPIIDYSVEW